MLFAGQLELLAESLVFGLQLGGVLLLGDGKRQILGEVLVAVGGAEGLAVLLTGAIAAGGRRSWRVTGQSTTRNGTSGRRSWNTAASLSATRRSARRTNGSWGCTVMSSEQQIQRLIMRGLRLAGYRVERIQAGRGRRNQHLASEGMPDLFVFGRGRSIWLEVKDGTGRTSEAQDATHAQLAKCGQHVAVVRSWSEALEAVKGAGA